MNAIPSAWFLLAKTFVAAILCSLSLPALADEKVDLRTAAHTERLEVIKTLRDLVNIETGPGQVEGLMRSAEYLKARLEAMGMSTTVEPLSEGRGTNVIGKLEGDGQTAILLLAHQDTVYQEGTVERKPFRIEDDRAFGPGIADDKGGIATILHALAILKQANFRNYKRITVLFNADEEVGSPGSKQLITQQAADHDVVLSCEPSRAGEGGISLATSGIGIVTMDIAGLASHAGVAPESGRNALVELAHQILQTKDLSRPEVGIKLNWTLAKAGEKNNVIPDTAQAKGDVRVWKNAQYGEIEKTLAERVSKRLIPDTSVKITVTPGRPALEATEHSVKLAAKAKEIYADVGRTLVYTTKPRGGGTDAAYAALSPNPVVLEGFGLVGDNYHSSRDEYVDLTSIEPRLYLLARMIIEVNRVKP